MRLLIDAGNSKVKWVIADDNRFIGEVGSIFVEDIAGSNIGVAAQSVSEVIVANVAGQQVEQQLRAVLGLSVPILFVESCAAFGGLTNAYMQPHKLGVDRWLALLAAHATYQTHCIIVNAGTAITVDALVVTPNEAKFLGGTISPGLRLMQLSLRQNTAQLNAEGGSVQSFPVNTDDAIYSGCVHAAIGAIDAQWQHLQKLVKIPPKLVLSGGDAAVIAKNLPDYLLKHHNIVDNLVLVGLMRLGREKA